MIVGFRCKFITVCLLLLSSGCEQQEHAASEEKPSGFMLDRASRNHIFFLKLHSQHNTALPVGHFHNWIIEIKDQDSKAVYPAVFSISGGMPEHGHGLPSQPEVSEYLGDGKYLLEGVKFNMDGEWQFRIEVTTQQVKDVVEFSVNVDY